MSPFHQSLEFKQPVDHVGLRINPGLEHTQDLIVSASCSGFDERTNLDSDYNRTGPGAESIQEHQQKMDVNNEAYFPKDPSDSGWETGFASSHQSFDNEDELEPPGKSESSKESESSIESYKLNLNIYPDYLQGDTETKILARKIWDKGGANKTAGGPSGTCTPCRNRGFECRWHVKHLACTRCTAVKKPSRLCTFKPFPSESVVSSSSSCCAMSSFRAASDTQSDHFSEPSPPPPKLIDISPENSRFENAMPVVEAEQAWRRNERKMKVLENRIDRLGLMVLLTLGFISQSAFVYDTQGAMIRKGAQGAFSSETS